MSTYINTLKSPLALPVPTSITSAWNFGSLLGACLGLQILTGLFLAMQYATSAAYSFEIVTQLSTDTLFGWCLRATHANGASMFFLIIYLHLSRGLYFHSFNFLHVWSSGVSLLLLLMAAAFLGYVLPWGQMSFWGATVITNLISAMPYVGQSVVYWLWGGFSVNNATLTRFFALHFILPLIMLLLVFMHLLFLHDKGSSNPLGLNMNLDKVPFHPYFTLKDLVGVVSLGLVLLFTVLLFPWSLGDTENFLEANGLVTPVHIKPEWYFLFAYAILRSIPNKLGGVLALLASVSILFVLPLIQNPRSHSHPLRSLVFYLLVSVFILLTWIGGKPVEDPYIMIGQMMSILYFVLILVLPTL